MNAQIGWLNGVPAVLLDCDGDKLVIEHDARGGVGIGNGVEGFEIFETVEVDESLWEAAEWVINLRDPDDYLIRQVKDSRRLVEHLPPR